MSRRLVERWHQQRVTNRTGIRSQQAPDPGYCLVEVVESAERHEAYPPTFWCLRIDVVEIAETGRILEVAETATDRAATGARSFAHAPVLRRGALGHTRRKRRQTCRYEV